MLQNAAYMSDEVNIASNSRSTGMSYTSSTELKPTWLPCPHDTGPVQNIKVDNIIKVCINLHHNSHITFVAKRFLMSIGGGFD